jgi:hypothetical protein
MLSGWFRMSIPDALHRAPGDAGRVDNRLNRHSPQDRHDLRHPLIAPRIGIHRIGCRWVCEGLVVYGFELVCRNYTDYARLALYRQGAFLGEPKEDEMTSEDIWKRQSTSLPSADDLRVDTSEPI